MHLLVLGAFLRSSTPTLTPGMASGLNAPYGARCFLTQETSTRRSRYGIRLNAPYGARCFLTPQRRVQEAKGCRVLMHRLALGAFRPGFALGRVCNLPVVLVRLMC